MIYFKCYVLIAGITNQKKIRLSKTAIPSLGLPNLPDTIFVDEPPTFANHNLEKSLPFKDNLISKNDHKLLMSLEGRMVQEFSYADPATAHVHQLTVKQQMLLTFCKLKHNMNFTVLAVLFDISQQIATDIFYRTLQAFSCVLKPLVYWQSRSVVNQTMPEIFSGFTDTRLVLNYIEICIEKPTCGKCQQATLPANKKNHMVKMLIGLSPAGRITFISRCYGSRVTDKYVYRAESINDYLCEGDALMVDVGFLAGDELIIKRLRMYRPSYKAPSKDAAQPLTKEQMELNAKIATARVNIDRTILSIRKFSILKDTIPKSMFPHIYKIVTVVCGLVNLSIYGR